MRPEDYMPRLAFIRYLYTVASDQSRLPLPMGAASIMGFQDSIELFLVLAAEHLDASIKDRTPFDDYFGIVNNALAKADRQGLTGAESIKRLNKARVTLKHHGIWPAANEIERFQNQAGIFFEDNAPLVFDGTDFNRISMVHLVQLSEAQQNLQTAESLLEQDKKREALGEIAIAFVRVIDNFKRPISDEYTGSPFDFPPGYVTAITEYHPGQLGVVTVGDGQTWETFVGDLQMSIDALQKAMEILSLGLDFRRYVRFNALTPYIRGVRVDTGTDAPIHYFAVKPLLDPMGEPTQADFRFCFDFVVDSALRLQQIDVGLQAEEIPQ